MFCRNGSLLLSLLQNKIKSYFGMLDPDQQNIQTEGLPLSFYGHHSVEHVSNRVQRFLQLGYANPWLHS
jgi:hypothetical protein